MSAMSLLLQRFAFDDCELYSIVYHLIVYRPSVLATTSAETINLCPFNNTSNRHLKSSVLTDDVLYKIMNADVNITVSRVVNGKWNYIFIMYNRKWAMADK